MARSDSPDLQLFLARLTARSVLSSAERQAILNLPTRTVQVEANRDYVCVGERVDHSCLVVEGIMARVGENRDGQRQITALHVPGDMADLHSVVRPIGTSALQALSTTTLLRIPHSALSSLAARFPGVAEAFWRDCMVDSAILSQWVVNVGRRDARTRLAHLLCEMAIRFGDERRPRLVYGFPVTQAQLADATGLTSVHINRTLRSLREAGLVDAKAKEVQILDWRRLVQLGEFDSTYLQADLEPAEKERLLA